MAEKLTPEERAAAADELSALQLLFAGPGPAALNYTPERAAAGGRHERIDELRELLGRQLWQRTQRAVWGALRMPAGKHREHVEAAVAAGKPVPPEVLADYPDLPKVANSSQVLPRVVDT